MNYAMICKSSQEAVGVEQKIRGMCVVGLLTLIKVRDGRLTLQLVLLLSELLERVVSLHMVPGIELEGIVAFFEEAGPKLEGIGTLLVVLRVVRSVRWNSRVASDRESRHALGELLLRISSPNLRL